MKAQFATGLTPYEIGDKVLVLCEEFIIEDIRMIQYIKDRRVEFEVLFKDVFVWQSWERIEKLIKP